MKTFQQIGDELGMSKQQAHRMFNRAVDKIKEAYEDEVLYEMVRELPESSRTLHDAMREQWLYEQGIPDELGDFWKEENVNCEGEL